MVFLFLNQLYKIASLPKGLIISVSLNYGKRILHVLRKPELQHLQPHRRHLPPEFSWKIPCAGKIGNYDSFLLLTADEGAALCHRKQFVILGGYQYSGRVSPFHDPRQREVFIKVGPVKPGSIADDFNVILLIE